MLLSCVCMPLVWNYGVHMQNTMFLRVSGSVESVHRFFNWVWIESEIRPERRALAFCCRCSSFDWKTKLRKVNAALEEKKTSAFKLTNGLSMHAVTQRRRLQIHMCINY